MFFSEEGIEEIGAPEETEGIDEESGTELTSATEEFPGFELALGSEVTAPEELGGTEEIGVPEDVVDTTELSEVEKTSEEAFTPELAHPLNKTQTERKQRETIPKGFFIEQCNLSFTDRWKYRS